MPLTLHALLGAAIGACCGTPLTAEAFGYWITASLIFAGLAHLVVVIHIAVWTRSLRETPTEVLAAGLPRAWSRAIALACGAALVPAGFLVINVGPAILIPAGIVFFTGMAFIPVTYTRMVRRIAREREVLDVTPPTAA
jgi:hypothetical protein